MKFYLVVSLFLWGLFPSLTAQTINDNQLISDIKELSSESYQGRKVGTEGNIKAQQFITDRFKSLKLLGFSPDYKQAFDFTQRRSGKKANGTNLIGYIKGSDFPDEFLVLSAHFDHEGIKNGKLYYGADDNASGTSALLGLADYFSKHQPKHSIVFSAFDAEESGLVGSNYFVNHCPVDLKKIKININMDMISRSDKQEIFAVGPQFYANLKPMITNLGKSLTTIKLLIGHDEWLGSSDHFSFYKKQIPFIYFGVEDHADYHKPTDTFDHIDQKFYKEVSNLILRTVLSADHS